MKPVAIRTEEDAFNWLEDYLDGEVSESGIVLEGWPSLTIRLTGEKFDQSLTPKVMQGLIDFQKAIYRSYALTKYGVPDPRKLTKEEAENLELKVRVEKGSTKLEIDLQGLLTDIATQAIGKMDAATIAYTVVGLGAIWAGSTMFKNFLEHRREIRKDEVKSETDREYLETLKFMSAEETKRASIMNALMRKDPALDNAERVTHDARTDMLKSFSRADTATIDGIELDPELSKILTTNARRKSEEVRLDGTYRILRNDTTDPTAFKVRIRNQQNQEQFDALVQDDTLTGEYKAVLRKAEWDRVPVQLRINAKSLEGSVRDAVVIHVEAIKEE